jgi:ribosome maturation factor RimP
MGFLSIEEPLWQILEAVVQDEGRELYDVEKLGSAGLRIFIKQATSEDCSKVLRRLMAVFLVDGPKYGLSFEPALEVSSPGINRELRLLKHFEGAVGERVKIVYKVSNDQIIGKKDAEKTGIMSSFSDNKLKIEEQEIELSAIKKARVDFQFGGK